MVKTKQNVDGYILGHKLKYQKFNIPHYSDYQNSANFFLHTTLASVNDNSDIHYVNGIRTTAGSVVQSLHKLKDTNNTGTIKFFDLMWKTLHIHTFIT